MKALIVASAKESALELVSGAAMFCAESVLITFSPEAAVCADRAYVISGAGSNICAAPMLADIVEKERPDLVMVQQNSDGRYFAAMLAAQLGTSALTDCTELFEDGGRICARRMSYGGAAFKTETAHTPAVACVGAGVFPAAAERACGQVETLEAAPRPGFSFVSREEKQLQNVNLGAAKRVVGVGRGIGSAENLALAERFAEAIGAELACTRPISEEEGWMPRERYIGVSGKMIKPRLYIALGISGQIQHTVGINQAATIISINRDKNAPMFEQSDYGLVGELSDVLPRLTELLS